MKRIFTHRLCQTALASALLIAGLTGCQANMSGQTLPSPNYLEDDVQYFPAGPETQLYRQIQALKEYELQQQGIEAGLNDLPPGPGQPPILP